MPGVPYVGLPELYDVASSELTTAVNEAGDSLNPVTSLGPEVTVSCDAMYSFPETPS